MSHRVKTVVAPSSSSSTKAGDQAPPLSRLGRCFFCCGWAPAWLTSCAFAATRACLGCCCFQTQSYTSVAAHHAGGAPSAAPTRRPVAHHTPGGGIELQLGPTPPDGLFAIDFESEEENEDEEGEEEEETFGDDFIDVGSASSTVSKAHAAAQLVRALCTSLHSFSPLPPKYVGSELKIVFDSIGASGVNSLARALLEQQRRFRLLEAHMEQTAALQQVDPHTAASFAASRSLVVRSVEFGIVGIGATNTGSVGASQSLKTLQKLLATYRSLDSFSLWGNQLTQITIRPIARGLASSTCALRSLSLANNDLNDATVAVLTDALVKNRTLTKLDLSGNQIGVSALPLLTHLSQANRLIHLHLAQNRIDDACCPVIATWLKRPAASGACPLETLDLATNLLSDVGVIQLCAALQQNSRLVQLSVHGHGLSQSAHLASQQALAHTARHFPRLVRVITIEDDDAQDEEQPPSSTAADDEREHDTPDSLEEETVPAAVARPLHPPPHQLQQVARPGDLVEEALGSEDELAANFEFDDDEIEDLDDDAFTDL